MSTPSCTASSTASTASRPASSTPPRPTGSLEWRRLPHEHPEAWPGVVVHTLWDVYISTLTLPLHRGADDSAVNHVLDSGDDKDFPGFGLYPDVPAIFQDLHARRIPIAVASRARCPANAQEALDTLLLPRPPSSSGSSSGSDSDGDANKGAPVPMRSYLKQAEIVVATKTHHMSEISRKMEVEYEEMLFFDDEKDNFVVEEVGVTMQLVKGGTSWATFNEGLAKWRERRNIVISDIEVNQK